MFLYFWIVYGEDVVLWLLVGRLHSSGEVGEREVGGGQSSATHKDLT